MGTAYQEATVGQLVAERPGRARVFEAYGIDYCCGGKSRLDAACERNSISLEVVVRELEASDTRPAEEDTDWTRAPLSDLADHIVAAHHDRLRAELPRVAGLIAKVVNAHGDRHAYLPELQAEFGKFRSELEAHMAKEELILFPLCKRLEASETAQSFHCGSIRNPIAVMEMEHDNAGHSMERFRSLTGGYAAPEGACNTFRAMLSGLEELEQDMHAHVHKENNILFPRAVALEAGRTGGPL